MGIKVTNSKTNIKGQRALKLMSAISTYLFENECDLKESEKKVLRNTNEILNKIVERNK